MQQEKRVPPHLVHHNHTLAPLALRALDVLVVVVVVPHATVEVALAPLALLSLDVRVAFPRRPEDALAVLVALAWTLVILLLLALAPAIPRLASLVLALAPTLTFILAPALAPALAVAGRRGPHGIHKSERLALTGKTTEQLPAKTATDLAMITRTTHNTKYTTNNK